MKKIFLLLAVVGTIILTGCTGPEGSPGRDGFSAESEVFELKNINFAFTASGGYTIYQVLNPPILASDIVLIYRMNGTVDASTPIWQLIPRTLFLVQGELDYDFDFSKRDFTIYAGGNYDLSLTPSYINNQTFRIVIIPGSFGARTTGKTDYSDYSAVIKKYNIDDSKVKILN